MFDFRGKVAFITGASRGVGRSIALRLAKEGAVIAIAAKTATTHKTLPGTIYTVANEISKLGAQALPFIVDVRHEDEIKAAVEKTVEIAGGIDIVVNNASAISLTSTLNTPAKRYDLMMAVNQRATFMCSQACIPHLLKAKNPHILNLSPPLNLKNKWFKDHLAYTMSKYGMSMCTLGLAAEYVSQGIAVNSLWPKTTLATAAIAVNFSKDVYEASRKPEIVADAACYIFARNSRECTGNFFIDEDILRSVGIHDFSKYTLQPGATLYPDLFID